MKTLISVSIRSVHFAAMPLDLGNVGAGGSGDLSGKILSGESEYQGSKEGEGDEKQKVYRLQKTT